VAASDDPVLADLESDLPTPVFTSYKQPKEKKVSGGLVALLLLVLAGGGFYAAWMYQPGFREMVRPLIERVLDLVGTPRPHQNATPARREPKPTSVTTPAPIAPSSASPVNPAQASAASPATGSPDSAAPASQASAPTTTETTPASDTEKPTSPTESKKNFIAAIPSDAELPGEKTAVILSSQGADKRLIHHVQATYPAEARKEHVEGTVVLKAIVSESGKVDGVRLVEGNPTLAAAAIRAVKQWRYRPYLRDGKPRPFQTVVLVEFQRP
jgi:TonB family protein